MRTSEAGPELPQAMEASRTLRRILCLKISEVISEGI